MTAISITLLICVTFASALPDEQKIALAGDLGKIRGTEVQTLNTNRTFIQFKGIPYGVNPRFGQSSLKGGPLVPGDGIFEADKFGPECPQTRGGEEHCLFMNIATHDVTNITEQNLRPVILFIHGAAFVAGNADAYTGEYLLKRDVVLVSFNYRLGVFGYFCLNTEDVPCNAALYDAITALQWVQKYIRFFGGNPNLVTLAGQSSGSASVSHILLSPLASGLFHRAMALSGTAINEWALASDPMTSSLRVAQLSGCYTPIPNVVPDVGVIGLCMKNTATQEQIIKAQDTYQAEERKAGRIGFAAVNPAVQTKTGLGTVPAFLEEHPLTILSRGVQISVPLMLGATKHDGAFGIVMLLVFHLIPNGNLQNDPDFLRNDLVPTMLSSLGIEDDMGGVYETVARTYLGDTRMSGNFSVMLPGLVDMASVFYFKASSYKLAQLHSRVNATYFYSFDFAGSKTQHEQSLLPFPEIVAHADDLIYVFPTMRFEFNAREKKMSDALVDYWVNFATTGEPSTYPDGMSGSVPNWPEFKENGTEYLIINDDIRAGDDYPGTWVSSGADDPKPENSSGFRTENHDVFALVTLVVATFIVLQ